MSRTFYPSQYFDIGSVWMAAAFNQYFNDEKASWETLMFYHERMSDEQQKEFFDRMAALYQKESLSTIISSLQYGHVRAWNEKHADALNEVFKKALKRKRSMDGEITLIVRWMNVVPQAVEWQNHLKGELNTWENIPNKFCDPDDLKEIMNYLGMEHPKYFKVMDYYMDRLHKSDASKEKFSAFYEQHYHLILTTDTDEDSHYNGVLDWLMHFPERVVQEWPTMNSKWQNKVADRMVNAKKNFEYYAALIAGDVHDDIIKNAILTNIDALAYYDCTFAIQQYRRFFPNVQGLSQLTNRGSHLIYRMTESNDDVYKIDFILELLVKRSMPTLANDYYYHSSEHAPIVQYGVQYMTQQTVAWIVLYLIINVCVSSGSTYSYRTERVPVRNVNIRNTERAMLSNLMQQYPIMENVLKSFQNTQGSNILLDVLKVVSFSGDKTKREEVEATANILLGADLYSFKDSIFEKLRFRLVREDGDFYVDVLECNYRSQRILDESLTKELQDYVYNITPLLDDNLKELNDMEEMDLMI